MQTIEQVTAKMKKTHTDLVHTIKMDLQMMGFSQALLAPLIKHEEEQEKKPGQDFINADYYNRVTSLALGAKLEVCSLALKTPDVSEETKSLAADILFSGGDSGALTVGIKTLLEQPGLMDQCQGHLTKVVAAAESDYKDRLRCGQVLRDLRLDLKDYGATTELPMQVLSLLAWAESFDLSGNTFGNIKQGTALADMVYNQTRWRDATLNWKGKQLTELAEAAQYLHSGDLTIDRATLQIKELRQDTELHLEDKDLGPDDARVIGAILPSNT